MAWAAVMSKRWTLVRRWRQASCQASSSSKVSDSTQRVVATYSDPVDAYTVSPGAITAVDSEGSKAPLMGTLITVVTPNPENTDGARASPHGTMSDPVELSADPVV